MEMSFEEEGFEEEMERYGNVIGHCEVDEDCADYPYYECGILTTN